LPWDYGVRNLFRRPARTLLTLVGLSTVVVLVLVVVGFIRGLESSIDTSGDPRVMLVYSIGAAGDVENSAVAARIPALLSASLSGIEHRWGTAYVSPELYIATRIQIGDGSKLLQAVMRGVTPSAPLLRRQVQLIDGKWPQPGEVLAGSLAAAKLGCDADSLATGRTITLDGRTWTVCGHFAAGGTAFESELWLPLPDLQQAMKRQDLSLVAVRLAEGASPASVEMFCKERIDLELQAISEAKYYALMDAHYRPIRLLGWFVVLLVAGAGIFAGLNTMYGAVVGRVKELATLQAVGFRRRAIALSLVQEGLLLAAASSLLAAAIAVLFLNSAAVRFTMGAFALRIDSVAIVVGCSLGLAIGLVGTIPPAVKAMRIPVAQGLKAI
jgi:ABC-type lipoprotein release transport system permease subunit